VSGRAVHPKRLGQNHPEIYNRKTAERRVKTNQKDQDTLPPYEILDEKSCTFTSKKTSAHVTSSRAGLDEKTVRLVQRRVDLTKSAGFHR